MGFKRIKCPVCGEKVSYFWYYLALLDWSYTCPNCNTKIKWHPIVRLYSVIAGIIMICVYISLKDYFEPSYISGIIGVIVGLIIFYLIPKKVKIISKGGEEKKE